MSICVYEHVCDVVDGDVPLLMRSCASLGAIMCLFWQSTLQLLYWHTGTLVHAHAHTDTHRQPQTQRDRQRFTVHTGVGWMGFRHTYHWCTLQHTATHCNTLQHTATRCIDMMHAHCNTLPHAYMTCMQIWGMRLSCMRLHDMHAQTSDTCAYIQNWPLSSTPARMHEHTHTHTHKHTHTHTRTHKVCIIRVHVGRV